MFAPSAVIGVAELNPQSWVGAGVLAVAQQLSMFGHRVVVLDADPLSELITPWDTSGGAEGPPMDVLLTQWCRGMKPTVITEPLATLLQDEPGLGAVGFVRATDQTPERRPPPPTSRALRLMREALNSLRLDGEPVDVVLVRLPPLSTALGVAMGANLVDVLVPMIEPTAGEVRQLQRALHRLTTLRGERPVVVPVEITEDDAWDAAKTEPLWLAGLALVPLCAVRPSLPYPAPARQHVSAAPSLVPDFRDLADALRLQLGLPHPFGQERLWEADALEDAKGAYAAFLSLIEEDAIEALRFFGESLSGRGATRATAVEALRAMVDSGRFDDDDLAWVLRYVVQRFRLEELDPRAEFLLGVATRLQRSAAAGYITERLPRLHIDIASAMLYAAHYRDDRGERGYELLPEAERVLMQAGLEVREPGDILRFVETLGVHARVSGKDHHCEMALSFIQLVMTSYVNPAQARRRALDTLNDFYMASKDKTLRAQHKALAESIVHESPAYAHYNLILAFARLGDKLTACEHLVELGKVDVERFRMVFADPDMDVFLAGAGQSDFYSPGPKRGKF